VWQPPVWNLVGIRPFRVPHGSVSRRVLTFRRPWADGRQGKRLRQTVDALGSHAEEGRGEPRNAPGSRTQALIR
jgi:hypothetical protein